MPSTRRAAANNQAPTTTPATSDRRSTPPIFAHKPLAYDPVPPPSPDVALLRKDWRFAAVCQFIFTFEEALQVKEFETEELEDDFTLGTSKILPQVMYRLLFTLTHDRRITAETWEHYLRIQYIRREPESPVLGTDDEPIEWTSLTQSQKLGAVYTVTEWEFANPAKIRKMMKDEENNHLWRIDPIGFDAKRNAYWLFDDNRLWIQRAPPKPKVSHKKKPPAERRPPAKKQKVAAAKDIPKAVPKPAPKPATPKGPPIENKAASRYPKRGAKGTPPATASPAKPRTVGTRLSSRLRGAALEDQWQEIPPEWLAEDATPTSSLPNGKGTHKATGDGKDTKPPKSSPLKRTLEDDDESDLTDLSDDELGEERDADGDVKMEEAGEAKVNGAEEGDQTAITTSAGRPTPPSKSEKPAPAVPVPSPALAANGTPLPADFVEWETLCVTLYEWENVAEQFAKATHKDEKALYKLLVDEVVPRVVLELREIERLKRLQEAVSNRKRSSRIAMRELEREAALAEEQKRAEEEDKHQRSRRYEARLKREEEERNKESERERRIREREERAARGRTRAEAWQAPPSGTPDTGGESGGRQDGEDGDLEVVEVDEPPQMAGKPAGANGLIEPWELDCEVCLKKGWNLDDGSDIICCDGCNKWQHMACHDKADREAGKQRRRWASVTFRCKACKNKHRRDLYAARQQAQQERQMHEKHSAEQAGPPKDPNGLKVHLTVPRPRPEVAATETPVTNGVMVDGVRYGARPTGYGGAHGARPYESYPQPAYSSGGTPSHASTSLVGPPPAVPSQTAHRHATHPAVVHSGQVAHGRGSAGPSAEQAYSYYPSPSYPSHTAFPPSQSHPAHVPSSLYPRPQLSPAESAPTAHQAQQTPFHHLHPSSHTQYSQTPSAYTYNSTIPTARSTAPQWSREQAYYASQPAASRAYGSTYGTAREGHQPYLAGQPAAYPTPPTKQQTAWVAPALNGVVHQRSSPVLPSTFGPPPSTGTPPIPHHPPHGSYPQYSTSPPLYTTPQAQSQ